VLGTGSALLYLHEEWEQCVVHRDIKPSNIMLDTAFNAKLGDFGLARLVDHDRGSHTNGASWHDGVHGSRVHDHWQGECRVRCIQL
jgi:serine/threonine protein kinase